MTPILTPDLREKDFGSLEGVHWQSNSTVSSGQRARPAQSNNASSTHKESESVDSMRRRVTSFLDEHFLPLLFDAPKIETNVAIVSHGIILRVLWNRIVELFDPMTISVAPGIATWDNGPAALFSPSWSNTGFMTFLIRSGQVSSSSERRLDPIVSNITSQSSVTNDSLPGQNSSNIDVLLKGWLLKILAVDRKEHLSGLHRTRGGIGSATHDTRQKRIDQFFKR